MNLSNVIPQGYMFYLGQYIWCVGEMVSMGNEDWYHCSNLRGQQYTISGNVIRERPLALVPHKLGSND